MATITSTIKLVDQMTPTLNKISKAIDRVNAQTNKMGSAKTWSGFNTGVRNATKSTHNLYNAIRRIAFTLGTLRSIQGAVEISDTMMNANARISNLTNDAKKTSYYMDAIYAASQRSRGNFMDMANSVGKLGTIASHAFGGSVEEMIAFTELMNKLFVISGASAAESSNAMYQLTQAMAAGKLQGDEMRSILENAPLLAQKIADALGVSIGEVKELGAEGKITANVIKDALFGAADDIEKKFENMPRTIGQVWTQIKNHALNSFRPVVDKIQTFINSPVFKEIEKRAYELISTVADRVIWLFDQFERPEVQRILKSLSKPLKVIQNIIGEIGAAIGRAYEWVLDHSDGVERIISAIASGLSKAWEILKKVGDLVVKVANWFSENWSKIEPIVVAVTAALAVYYAWMLLCKVASFAFGAVMAVVNGIVWLFTTTLGNVVLLVASFVILVFLIVDGINQATGSTISALGVLSGVLGGIIAFFTNFGPIMEGVVSGIAYSFRWLCDNVRIAFVRIGEWLSNFGSALGAVASAIGQLIGVAFDILKGYLADVGSNIAGTFQWIGACAGVALDNMKIGIAQWAENVPLYFDLFKSKAVVAFWSLVLKAVVAFNSLIRSTSDTAGEMLKPFEGFVNGVIDGFTKIVEAWNAIAGKLGTGITIFGQKFSIDLPKFDVPKGDWSAAAWAKANIKEINASGIRASLIAAKQNEHSVNGSITDINWNTTAMPEYSDYADWKSLSDYVAGDPIALLKMLSAVDNLKNAWGDSWKDAEYTPWVDYNYDWSGTFKPIVDGYWEWYKKGENAEDKLGEFIEGANSFINDVFNGENSENGGSKHESIKDKITDIFTGQNSDNNVPSSVEDLLSGYGGSPSDLLGAIADNTGKGAGSTANIEDTLDLAEDELELLRKIAEKEVINRFTTAEINVNMTNNNNVNSGMDLDGIVTHLSNKLYEELGVVASGVHY